MSIVEFHGPPLSPPSWSLLKYEWNCGGFKTPVGKPHRLYPVAFCTLPVRSHQVTEMVARRTSTISQGTVNSLHHPSCRESDNFQGKLDSFLIDWLHRDKKKMAKKVSQQIKRQPLMLEYRRFWIFTWMACIFQIIYIKKTVFSLSGNVPKNSSVTHSRSEIYGIFGDLPV